MTKAYLKSTTKEIERMVRLRRKGKSYLEIAEALNKDRTTIAYWLTSYKDKRIKDKGRQNLTSNGLKRIKKELRIKTREQLKIEEVERCKREGICLLCKKPKNSKWFLTNYCSISCWVQCIAKKNPKWSGEISWQEKEIKPKKNGSINYKNNPSRHFQEQRMLD